MECSKLHLKIPAFKELNYRRKLLLDKETMSYNKGYGDFQIYNEDTGCIDFNEGRWQTWFSKWINNMPERYYAYIIKTDENIPIGEVALRYDSERNAHCVDIIIEAKYRGHGYSEQALRLLVDAAFNQLKLDKIYDNFSNERVSAEKVFKKVGFKRVSEGIVELTKEDYLKSLINIHSGNH